MQAGALTSVVRSKRGNFEDGKSHSRTHLLEKRSTKNLLNVDEAATERPQISVTDLIRQERLKQSSKESKPLAQQLWRLLMLTASLLLIGGTFSLLFIVPIVIDPAMATIQARIHPQPVRCRTERVERLVSLDNCSWSSCREGCTRDVYQCIHVYVSLDLPRHLIENKSQLSEKISEVPSYNSSDSTVFLATNYDSSTSPDSFLSEDQSGLKIPLSSLSSEESRSLPTKSNPSTMSSSTLQSLSSTSRAMLLVNVKTCGYPPRTNCSLFESTYAVEGEEFSCYFSMANYSVAITDFRPGEADIILADALTLPLTAIVVGLAGICCLQLTSLFCKNLSFLNNLRTIREKDRKYAEKYYL